MAAKPASIDPAVADALAAHATEPWIRFGNRVLIGVLLGLVMFGVVSISGAVVATGVVNVENNYKMVQHLDGGIVAKILVRNGDRVKEGHVLVRLDETMARQNLAVVLARMNDLLAQQARLEAERDRKESIDFPADVLRAADADAGLAKIVHTQKTLFQARLVSRKGEQGMLRQKLAQATSEAAGVEQVIAAKKREQEITAAELASVKPLFERGYASQQRLLPIERDTARLAGEVGRMQSDLQKSRSTIAEVELKIAQSEKDFTQAVVDELRKVQAQLGETVEQRTALEDKLRRIDIRAPRSGRVHALNVHTEGGVIQPGTPIMQVVPEGERLVVDGQVQPQDIDKIRKGQPAFIRFPAFNARLTPRLDGTVVNVSAAQLTDQTPGARPYFTVQVALNDGEREKIAAGHEIVPGMPAEIYIETGGRSILSYFVKPLVDAISHAFRET